MEVREAITVVHRRYTVDVLQDARNDSKRYYLFAATPLDARVLAFALDGGFRPVICMQTSDIELAKSYTTIVEADAWLTK